MVYWLEECFRIPGTDVRFGWEPILGFFIPGIGDVAGLGFGLPILAEAFRRGLPWPVRILMAVNLLLDAIFGFVPVLGDVFDFVWKAQRKNLLLLEHPEALGTVLREARGRIVVLSILAAVLLVVFLAGLAALAAAAQALLRSLGL